VSSPSNNSSKIVNQKDLLAYFFVAGTGALVQLLTSSLSQDWFGLTFNQSINIAYPVSLVVGFILTKLFAFNVRNTNQTRREMVKFVMVAIFSWGVTWVFAVGSLTFATDILQIPIYRLQLPLGHKTINVNEMTCYIIGQGFSFVSNYLLHKTFTFKSTGFYDRLKALIS
jgi:putative flippase GtrA